MRTVSRSFHYSYRTWLQYKNFENRLAFGQKSSDLFFLVHSVLSSCVLAMTVSQDAVSGKADSLWPKETYWDKGNGFIWAPPGNYYRTIRTWPRCRLSPTLLWRLVKYCSLHKFHLSSSDLVSTNLIRQVRNGICDFVCLSVTVYSLESALWKKNDLSHKLGRRYNARQSLGVHRPRGKKIKGQRSRSRCWQMRDRCGCACRYDCL